MAKKWIFVRGLGRGNGHWGLFRELLLQHVSAEDVEFLDLKGNGDRFRETSFISIDKFMEDIRYRSQFLKDGHRVNLVTLSLGGMVCVEWAHRHHKEVESLTLISTSSADSPFYQRFNLKMIPLLLKGATGTLREREKCILQIVANNAERRDAEYPSFAQYSEQNPLRISNVLRQIWAAAQYKMPQKLTVPVTLIGSYGDRLVSPKCTLLIAKLWGLQPIMHPWGGHDLGVDDPHWLIENLALKSK